MVDINPILIRTVRDRLIARRLEAIREFREAGEADFMLEADFISDIASLTVSSDPPMSTTAGRAASGPQMCDSNDFQEEVIVDLVENRGA